MNTLKVRAQDGKLLLLRVQQKPDPLWTDRGGKPHGGGFDNAPARLKARVAARGFVLAGTRQR